MEPAAAFHISRGATSPEGDLRHLLQQLGCQFIICKAHPQCRVVIFPAEWTSEQDHSDGSWDVFDEQQRLRVTITQPASFENHATDTLRWLAVNGNVKYMRTASGHPAIHDAPVLPEIVRIYPYYQCSIICVFDPRESSPRHRNKEKHAQVVATVIDPRGDAVEVLHNQRVEYRSQVEIMCIEAELRRRTSWISSFYAPSTQPDPLLHWN